MHRRSFLSSLPFALVIRPLRSEDNGTVLPADFRDETCEFFWLSVWASITQLSILKSPESKRRIAELANLHHLTQDEAYMVLLQAWNQELGFDDIPNGVINLDERVAFERDKQRIRRDLRRD